MTIPVSDYNEQDYLTACGFSCLGKRAVRVDVLDRLAGDLQRQSRSGNLEIGATELNLLGLSMEDARPVFEALGYVAEQRGEKLTWRWAGRPRTKKRKRQKSKAEKEPMGSGNNRKKNSGHQKFDETSPFAKLRDLKLT